MKLFSELIFFLFCVCVGFFPPIPHLDQGARDHAALDAGDVGLPGVPLDWVRRADRLARCSPCSSGVPGAALC